MVCVSAGYDKTVRCWSTKTRRETASLEGHRAPVLELAWSSDGGLASGDRDGRMFLWDARSGKKDAVGKRKACEGHVTALAWTRRVGYEAVMRGGDVLVSGGQDGVVKVWDFRIAGKGACVASIEAHARKNGSGAVGDVCQTRGGRIVTGGADGRLAVLDPRMGYATVGEIGAGDFVYSLMSVGPMVVCGTGAARRTSRTSTAGTSPRCCTRWALTRRRCGCWRRAGTGGTWRARGTTGA